MEQATAKLLIHLDEVLQSKRIENIVAKSYNRSASMPTPLYFAMTLHVV